MKLPDPVRIFTLMKWVLDASNNMLCTFLNFREAATWKPETFLHEVNTYKIDSGGKRLSFWFTLKGNFLKISNCFIPSLLVHEMYQTGFPWLLKINTWEVFILILNTDLSMNEKDGNEIILKWVGQWILDWKQFQYFKHQIFFLTF